MLMSSESECMVLCCVPSRSTLQISYVFGHMKRSKMKVNFCCIQVKSWWNDMAEYVHLLDIRYWTRLLRHSPLVKTRGQIPFRWTFSNVRKCAMDTVPSLTESMECRLPHMIIKEQLNRMMRRDIFFFLSFLAFSSCWPPLPSVLCLARSS